MGEVFNPATVHSNESIYIWLHVGPQADRSLSLSMLEHWFHLCWFPPLLYLMVLKSPDQSEQVRTKAVTTQRWWRGRTLQQDCGKQISSSSAFWNLCPLYSPFLTPFISHSPLYVLINNAWMNTLWNCFGFYCRPLFISCQMTNIFLKSENCSTVKYNWCFKLSDLGRMSDQLQQI